MIDQVTRFTGQYNIRCNLFEDLSVSAAREERVPGKVVKLRPCISFPLVCVPPRNPCTPDCLGHQSSGDGYEVASM
jgi:hypothetical protein